MLINISSTQKNVVYALITDDELCKPKYEHYLSDEDLSCLLRIEYH